MMFHIIYEDRKILDIFEVRKKQDIGKGGYITQRSLGGAEKEGLEFRIHADRAFISERNISFSQGIREESI